MVIRDLEKLKRGDALGGDALPPFKEGFMTAMVTRADNLPDRERIESDYIHVSAMVGWCPRKYAIQGRAGIYDYTYRRVSGAMRIVWAIGKAVEKHIRTSFIRSVDFRGVFGVWMCICEKSEHVGFYDVQKVCRICKGKLCHYHEYPLYDDEHHVTGNPDLLMVRRKRIYPAEVKSLTNGTAANAKKMGFDSITAPFGDHVFQVDAYHYMLERSMDGALGLVAGDRVIVMYGNKEFKYGQSYKEYWLKAVEPQRKALIRKTFKTAKEVYESIHDTSRPLPKRTLCPSQACPRAKECPVALECFARK